MKPKFLIFFTALILLLSCTKEKSDLRLSNFNIPEVKGFYIRNGIGVPVFTIGTPNVKLCNESNEQNSEYFFSVFPNPSISICRIYIKSPNNNSKIKLWITYARFINEIPNSLIDIGMNNAIVGGVPLMQLEYNCCSGSDSDILCIDVSSFPEGYYRVYLKIDKYLLYDNLIITNKLIFYDN